MGYHPSYQPVDPEVAARVAGYIAGGAKIDDLVERAARHAATRERTTEWGLALVGMRRQGAAPPAFVPWLHVWGRPFFIAVDGGTAIAAMIDRYLAASSRDEVDRIVRENLALLDPDLASHFVPMPDEQNFRGLAKRVREPLDFLRSAFAAAKKGRQVRTPDGDTTDARALVTSKAAFHILKFCSILRPGWMDRGCVWPQALFREAKLSPGHVFEPPWPLLGRLALAFSAFGVGLGPEIENNYTVGGYVRAYNVPKLAAATEANRAALEGCYASAGVTDDDVRRSVQEQAEALEDAKLRGLAFVEATEIYSAPSGELN